MKSQDDKNSYAWDNKLQKEEEDNLQLCFKTIIFSIQFSFTTKMEKFKSYHTQPIFKMYLEHFTQGLFQSTGQLKLNHQLPFSKV